MVLATLAAVNLGAALAILFRRRASFDTKQIQPGFDAALAETRRVEQSLRDEFKRFGDSTDTRFSTLRRELNDSATQTRTGIGEGFKSFQTTVRDLLAECSKTQGTQLVDFAQRLDKVNETLTQQLEKMRSTVELKLADLQTKNEQKLEEMRRTVDEKLESTLERRLGESFKFVSERLEQVHKGLGEMQAMASSVGDLKRVLTNVKTRGTWGEIQLGVLLEQLLTPDQYGTNVAPKPDSAERVEFAIRLPGNNDEAPVWLPIDAKFPQEDYQRLVEAADRADPDGVLEAGKALEIRLRNQARDIRDKYIAPPFTTDFAIQFLPSEGLYAEALRRPGLADSLQREFRVLLAGPSILAALLNCLQMGFRTLAIERRSSEVWRVLAAVKTEFGKFGDVISKVKKKLEEASNHIEQTEVRSRAIGKKLRDVEALPAEEVARLLPEQMTLTDEGDENGPEGRRNLSPLDSN
ncbi:MAG TPA: DNA recombination protein RmuC [Verrucomicrobiae bacterium]|nr:DNA recombination protein RmuC [Verrucomicrobiae bacterium]